VWEKACALLIIAQNVTEVTGFRFAALAFFKKDFEILDFFEHFWLFLEIKKARQILPFFSGKS